MGSEILHLNKLPGDVILLGQEAHSWEGEALESTTSLIHLITAMDHFLNTFMTMDTIISFYG